MTIRTGRPDTGMVGPVHRLLKLLVGFAFHAVATNTKLLAIGCLHCRIKSTPEQDAHNEGADMIPVVNRRTDLPTGF